MNQAIKDRWVNQLRANTIQQGFKNLGYTDGRRCCLGVLCDLAVEDGIIPPPTIGKSGSPQNLLYDFRNNFLPKKVQYWAEMNSVEGIFLIDPTKSVKLLENTVLHPRESSLASQNDASASFHEIADIIDAYWEEL